MKRWLALASALVLLAAVFAAVGAVKGGKSQGRVVAVYGSGATFPYPQLLKWVSAYKSVCGSVAVSYQPVGSGAGQRQLFDGVVDFCCSDPPLSHAVWEKYRGRILQAPLVLGAVVVSYNVPELGGVTLNLTGRVLALIYAGKVRYWDDPRIAELNPGARLPHREIVVVYRADASGTQEVFTTFLHKAAPDAWPASLVGKSVRYPVVSRGTAIGAKGNPGVVQVLKNTEYSLGFLEWSYAIENHLPVAAIENGCGEYVKPSVAALEAAARAAVSKLPSDPRDDFSNDLSAIVYCGARGSYPLTSWSHIVLWSSYRDRGKAEALASFLRWVYSHGSEHLAAGYAALPPEAAKLLLKAASLLEG